MGEPGDSQRTIDAATLRYLARILAQQSEVSGTSLFPANKQESLIVHLSRDYYPTAMTAVWLELRVYTNGEFHVSYLERYRGDQRRCRWDRHDQSHNSRDHFHPFPTASTTGAEDREFPPDLTTVLQTVVLPWVEDRLGEVWEE